METNKVPVLDSQVLQDKTNEYALKGAIDTIKEFYIGYNSPYCKAIRGQLNDMGITPNIDLPDIISIINDSLSREIDIMANETVAKSFLPLVRNLLIREDKEIFFSTILKKFIDSMDSDEYRDYSISIEKSSYGWLNVKLICNKEVYEITLHVNHKNKECNEIKYSILSLPYNMSIHKQTMKISLDGATLEMPFIQHILQDSFISYIAKLVMFKSIITIDCEDFDEEMFENND
jgi:hypothetical protein